MKKFLSILFLSVFFFSQFGKVVNFCLCTIDAYQQTGSITCDCEKQLSVAVTAETKKQDHQHSILVPQSEVLFQLNTISFKFEYITEPSKRFRSHNEALYNEWVDSIFHPPGITAIV